jgi:hypothetical protein
MTDKPRPQDETELVELIRSIDVAAPRHVHERIEEMTARGAGRRTRAPRRRHALRLRVGAAATGLAALAAVLVLALSGGTSGGLSVAQAAAVTLRPATAAAPGESARDRAALSAAVEGVSFPYWGARFGWRATGTRVDSVAGRRFETVLYGDGNGHTVGYSIASGSPAPALAGAGREVMRGGTAYRVSRVGGVSVVTWKRDGHLCVVAGRGVSDAKLLALARWGDTQRSA